VVIVVVVVVVTPKSEMSLQVNRCSLFGTMDSLQRPHLNAPILNLTKTIIVDASQEGVYALDVRGKFAPQRRKTQIFSPLLIPTESRSVSSSQSIFQS
jgi:hypothetical protein